MNHLKRWLQKEGTGTNPQQVQFNCPVGFDSSFAAPACSPNQQTENSGQLVSEIQGHGLTAIPGTALNSPADVPIETYSNKEIYN